MKRFLFIFLFFLLSDVDSSLLTNITNIGKCDALVSKLVLHLHSGPDYSDENYQEYYQNVTNVCKNVSNCYGSLKSESAQKMKRIYDLRCEKYEFNSYKMDRCFGSIISDKYSLYSSKCNGTYDFTTTDLTARRKAFTDGKSCVLEIADNSCYSISYQYLESNYERFVNILTTKPEDESCESLFAETNKNQCKLMRWNMKMIWDRIRRYKEYKSDDIYNIQAKDHCNILKECSSDPCNTYPNSQQMEKCEIIESITSEFHSCFEKYAKDEIPIFKECREQTDKIKCTRNTMIEKCGESSVKDFYTYFDFFEKNNLKELKNFEFMGNYSEFDDVKSPESNFSADSEVGKCFPNVESLAILLYENREVTMTKYYPKAIKLCNKITECFGSINSTESQKLKDFYQISCDSFEFYFNELYYCFQNFYKTERYGKKHSIENSNFFSKNLTLRKAEFVSQKSYFTKYADKECTPGANRYLKDRYDRFVDMITMNQGEGDCKSVFSVTESFPCTPIIVDMIDSTDLTQGMTSSFADLALKECSLAERCLENTTCSSKITTKIRSWCDAIKQEGAIFYKCLETLRQGSQKTTESCLHVKFTKKNTGEEYAIQFESHKECLKQIMLEKCGSEAVLEFDRFFEKIVQKHKENIDYSDNM